MAYPKVMTAKAAVELLIHIGKDVDSEYISGFPYNLGRYNENKKFSWDCWNLWPKSLIWGWKENRVVGYYAKYDPSTGLGDWGGTTIMSKCEEVSTDFSKLTPGEFLLSTDGKHAGAYIGEYIINGKCYNVVECTTSWKERRVCFSYVTSNGTRYHYKDGSQSSAIPQEKAPTSWGKHGKLPWIDYSVLPEPPAPPTPPEEPIYYTVVRGDALYKIAAKFKVTIADLVKWNKITNPNLIYVGQKLIVGWSAATPVPDPEPEQMYYTVQRGDNLSKIAAKFGTTVKQLVTWNNIKNANLIFTGQVLRVK